VHLVTPREARRAKSGAASTVAAFIVARGGGTNAGTFVAHADVRNAVDLAMDRYAAGDQSAFADVYDGVAPRIYAYLRRQTGDAARAEDLLQQTLLQFSARVAAVAGLSADCARAA